MNVLKRGRSSVMKRYTEVTHHRSKWISSVYNPVVSVYKMPEWVSRNMT